MSKVRKNYKFSRSAQGCFFKLHKACCEIKGKIHFLKKYYCRGFMPNERMDFREAACFLLRTMDIPICMRNFASLKAEMAS